MSRLTRHIVPAVLLALASVSAQQVVVVQPADLPAEPTTRYVPNHRAASVTAPDALALLEGLGAKDPAARADARERILSLSRADLPALASAAARLAPLGPEQTALLRDLVTHVYLSGEPYDAIATRGFLGIGLQNLVTLTPPTPDAPPAPEPPAAAFDDAVPPGAVGIIVTDPAPGLASYRYFQDGDVILTVAPFPALRSPSQFQAVLAARMPGDTVRFRVLRGGRTLDLPVVLSARPLAGVSTNLDVFRAERRQLADAYWTSTFAPLLDPPAPTTNPTSTPPPSDAPATRP